MRLTIEGKVAAQFWAAFVPPREKQPASFALQQIALTRRMIALYPDVFLPAFEMELAGYRGFS